MRVPFYRQQDRHTCGPAALRMVLSGLGTIQSEDRLAELGDTLETGTLITGLARAAQQLGHRSECRKGLSGRELMKWLRAGHAPILLIDPEIIYPDAHGRSHFVVVYQVSKNLVFLHDPDQGPSRLVDWPDFEAAWEARGREAVRIWR